MMICSTRPGPFHARPRPMGPKPGRLRPIGLSVRPSADGNGASESSSAETIPVRKSKVEGASVDLSVIFSRMKALATPYWTDPEVGGSARWKLAAVVGLTLGTTAVSVCFNYLGRDFFNALAEKDVDAFQFQLMKYLGAFIIGIPVFVFKSYFQSKLALEWRQWMTEELMRQYFADRTFYQLSAGGGGGKGQLSLAGASISGTDSDSDSVGPVAVAPVAVDNPDQRISSDIAAFTDTAVGLSLTILNATVDLISFSGILYAIYPPLFWTLIAYSVGGTVASIYVGRSLVGLNFNQEAREADFRYNLVRVRENAESIAFFRGENDERSLLMERLRAAVENYLGLLRASRNLDFFTSFYRYLIQLLPAAVVAPLFFKGQIEFGVINQSTSAFNHVLNDLSLVVYQFESLAGFSAVVDRLGQFTEVMEQQRAINSIAPKTTLITDGSKDSTSTATTTSEEASTAAALMGEWHAEKGLINLSYDESAEAHMLGSNGSSHSSSASAAHQPLLTLQDVSVYTPNRAALLVEDLSIKVMPEESLLIMGPSGAGKTSVLRAIAGLWRAGDGTIILHASESDIMFLPQKPYMVLGTLRDQVLYPSFKRPLGASKEATSASSQTTHIPPDSEILAMLRKVRLDSVLLRYDTQGTGGLAALDSLIDWSASLSLGEQQRLAWARLLLAKPKLALMDEATSALDTNLEVLLYEELARSGITYVSVGHRPTLKKYHKQMLEVAPNQDKSSNTIGSWQLVPLSADVAA